MTIKPPSPPSTPSSPSPQTLPPPSSQHTSPCSSPSKNNILTFRPDLLVPSPATPPTFPITLGTLIEVRLTDDGKGLGVFALKDIEAGSVMLFEEPLLAVPRSVSAPDVGDLLSPDPLDELVGALSLEGREIWDGLCAYKREDGESGNRARLWSNGYSIKEDSETGVFGVGSRVDHCCVGTCLFEWRELASPLESQENDGDGDGVGNGKKDGDGDSEGGKGKRGKGGLLIWNSWKILEGEEIVVDYGHKRRGREEWYGFVCGCGGCTDGESEEDSEEEGMDVDGERENEDENDG